ncbi:pyruvate, phosphate dikinase [Mycoplasmatota bacterium]|nr:pyruvate, phosphate dikinase [Mycoplasmatota bacterium]
MGKYVFDFKEGINKGKALLGGKGAALVEMSRLGINVPSGFTIITSTCNLFYEKEEKLWDELKEEIIEQVLQLEKATGKKFGDMVNPLLVSVRSGAAISMPGMMDTILNLGLNDQTVLGLAQKTNNRRFAYDSYRRFIEMFSSVVMGIEKYKFDQIFDFVKEQNHYHHDIDLQEEDLQRIVSEYKKIYQKETGLEFPNDTYEQLFLAIEAVFKSWNNNRAIIYRNIHEIPHDLGTAVNIQSMVFGNMGNQSGTGVAFTRNPSTGENKLFGEYLINAQGEDVVSGVRTPKTIQTLSEEHPQIFEELNTIAKRLENHYLDMQDIEFTIEEGKLYLLQTRNGKRTIQAAIRIAVELVKESKITKKEAISRINPKQLDQLLHPNFDQKELEETQVLTKGLPASPGASSGKVYFNAQDILKAKERGETVILVRQETSPEDIEGMVNAIGIVTSRGGMTSHAAVVARGMGKCCVVGCMEMQVSEQLKEIRVGENIVKEGDYISLDGMTGNVYLGQLKTVDAKAQDNFALFMEWVDEIKRLKVRANADTTKDTQLALNLGAEGIGLCRTEHMFFAEDRILEVRKMILSKTIDERQLALDKLLKIQTEDFINILKLMEGKPCTIRLLDPPLHEFLPTSDEDIKLLCQEMNLPINEVKRRIKDLEEFNPMLGHRGCRLAITYPEIYLMQTRAIIEATITLVEKQMNIIPEIMIPLVVDAREFQSIKALLTKEINQIFKDKDISIPYTLGTMIETPRACLVADEIAEVSQFFSFGTNDLTQMTYGFSRDDSHKYIKSYIEKQIFEKDPFQILDQKGLGKIMNLAIELGRSKNPSLKLGICGEHGGEPSTVEFCHHLGLDYVSCSPYRVPIAKLAAALAVIKKEKEDVS